MDKKEDIKEKVKRKVREFRRKKDKTVGEVDIPAVSKPKKKDPKQKREIESKPTKQEKRAVIIGPRGGKYVETGSGKKRYANRDKVIKSILKEIVSADITDFVKEFKKGSKSE